MTRQLQQFLKYTALVVVLALLGFAAGLILRVAYFGDDIVFVWPF